MAKEYMVGTLDDKPLLMVSFNGKNYFVDEEQNIVYADEPDLPQVKEEDVVAGVLEAANVG